MEEKPNPEAIEKIIAKLKEPRSQSQPSSKLKSEDEKVKTQVESAVEKAAKAPDATQG